MIPSRFTYHRPASVSEAVKLLLEFAHQQGYVHFLIHKWLSLGLIVVIFAIAFLYARRHPHVETEEETAAPDVDRLGDRAL